MKLREEFAVPHALADVWKFFEQAESVAACMPGIESVTVIDDDNLQVRVTQGIGPMTATFEAKVTVTERVSLELVRFRAQGRSVRGAVGNLRMENAVHLIASNGGTTIVVEGEVVLAGALGSVGQKIVAKQAAKVTAEFASNLERALRGEPVRPAARSLGGVPPIEEVGARGTYGAPREVRSVERWSKAAAALSAVSAVLSLLAILRQRRGSAR